MSSTKIPWNRLRLTKDVPFPFCAESVGQKTNNRSCDCISDLAQHDERSCLKSFHLKDTLHEQHRVAEPNPSTKVVVDMTQRESNLLEELQRRFWVIHDVAFFLGISCNAPVVATWWRNFGVASSACRWAEQSTSIRHDSNAACQSLCSFTKMQ